MRFIAHVFLFLVSLVISSTAFASTNVLLGKKAEFSISPNYLPASSKNATNLTDGKFKSISIVNKYSHPWTSDETVSWSLKRKLGVQISYDLGEKHIIDKLVLKTHGGQQVPFPLSFKAFTSNNGKNWQYVGDLIDRTISTYHEHNSKVFTLDGLSVEGRYVAFFAYKGGFYMCLDEIEAYGVKGSLNTNFFVYNINSIDDYVNRDLDLMKQKKTSSVIISEARRAMNSCNTSASNETLTSLNNLQREVNEQGSILPQSDEELGLPYTVIDNSVVNLVAKHFKNLLKEDFSIEKLANEKIYENYSPFHRNCEKVTDSNFNVNLARNDQESIAMQIANNTQSSKNLSYNIVLNSKANNTAWPVEDIQVYKSINVLQGNLAFIDEMLAPINNGKFETHSGINQMMWVKFDSKNVPFGDYKGYISIRSGAEELKRFSLNVKVNPLLLDFNEHLSHSWSHLDEASSKITNNRQLYIDELNNYRDNVQTILHAQLPWPKVNPVTGKFYEPMQLDFTKMDELIKSRPDVKLWLLATFFRFDGRAQLNYHRSSLTYDLYSDEHKAFVKTWIKSIASHMKSINVNKENYAFYWYDEANIDAFLNYVVPFSKMAKEVDPNIQTYGTHFLPIETLLKYPNVYDIHVITSNFLNNDSRYLDFAKKYNKTIYTYSVNNVKSVDPVKIRLLHAEAYAKGLNGTGIWTWNDSGGAFNEILSNYPSQALMYRTKTGPASSKRREAWREGNEDVALWRALSKLDTSVDMRAYVKKNINLVEYRKDSLLFKKDKQSIFEKTKQYPQLYTLPVYQSKAYKTSSNYPESSVGADIEQSKYKTCLKPNKLMSKD